MAFYQQAEFEQLATGIFAGLQGSEQATLSYQAESSDFVRFNRAAVRQAGHVSHQELSLRLVDGRRHSTLVFNLSGSLESDIAMALNGLPRLREQIALTQEDPHLLVAWTGEARVRCVTGQPPEVTTVIADVARLGAGLDLVGYYAGGMIMRGFAASTGLIHWHQTPGYILDWSLHLPQRAGERRAAKLGMGGLVWDAALLEQRMQEGRAQLEFLELPLCPVQPGEVRAYLAPDALSEILSLAGWGFGAMALHTRNSIWLKQLEGQALHPEVFLLEATADGLAAPFEPDGFPRPDRVPLIEGGQLTGKLISARSAAELGIAPNGASASEGPESLSLAPGSIPSAQILERLGTGLYVSNLWYTNVSDRSAGRITGLTRFASVWVENGKVVGPIPTMRFDDTLSRMLGAALEGLTDHAEFIPASDSYGWRSISSWRTPGALLNSFRLVL